MVLSDTFVFRLFVMHTYHMDIQSVRINIYGGFICSLIVTFLTVIYNFVMRRELSAEEILLNQIQKWIFKSKKYMFYTFRCSNDDCSSATGSIK
jgi:hypothetical protein